MTEQRALKLRMQQRFKLKWNYVPVYVCKFAKIANYKQENRIFYTSEDVIYFYYNSEMYGLK